MDALTLASLASLEQAKQLNKAYAKIERLQAELEAKANQVDDILTAYRAAIDAQQIKKQARDKVCSMPGIYHVSNLPAFAEAQYNADMMNIRLFELLDKAAYPEKQTSE